MDDFKVLGKYTKRLLILPATHPRHEGTTVSPNDELKIALHDYRIANPQASARTLLFTHGTSFNKDLWHLIIDELLQDSQLEGKISRVIAMDAVTHGDSAVLNAGKLANQAFWPDNAYDILTVTQTLGITGQVVGIGHSFGGGTLAHAAVMSPNTFIATILVDPILFIMPREDAAAAAIALRRRDEWPTLTAARASFAQSKRLSDWDPRQREVYAEKGLITATSSDGNSKLVLKTPKALEAATYLAAPLPGLPDLLSRFNGRHIFVLGAKSRVINPQRRLSIQEHLSASGTSLLIPDAGHLIPMTHPMELARILREQVLLLLSTQDNYPKHKM